MNQLTDDVKTLKDAGFISIARQYSRMARCLQDFRRYAEAWDQIADMRMLAEDAAKALRRFEK